MISRSGNISCGEAAYHISSEIYPSLYNENRLFFSKSIYLILSLIPSVAGCHVRICFYYAIEMTVDIHILHVKFDVFLFPMQNNAPILLLYGGKCEYIFFDHGYYLFDRLHCFPAPCSFMQIGILPCA